MMGLVIYDKLQKSIKREVLTGGKGKCQHSRNKVGCKATSSTWGNTITRYTKVAHTCQKTNDLCVAFHDAKRNVLKYISEAPTSCNAKNVFNTELSKTVKGFELENGYDELAPQLPVIFQNLTN